MSQAAASTRRPHAADGGANPVRLMLVDDSTVARAVLTRMIETDPQFRVVAEASTAEDALEKLKHVELDIILLDLEMPGAGGLAKLPDILEASHGAQVLVVSSLAEEGAEVTVSALAMGASDTLPKPGTGRFNGTFSTVLLDKLRGLGRAVRRGSANPRKLREHIEIRPVETAPTSSLREDAGEGLDILCVGASTGGIHALAAFFASLPPKLDVPICVTQHLPHAFMPVFARQLSQFAGRPTHVAEHGHPLLADRVYVAPGDKHLTVKATGQGLMCRLTDTPQPHNCLPSVDPMFTSAAEACGQRACGIVLTGMGRDGSEGARTLAACGGSVMVQDEASCAVWGMPRSVYEAGLANHVGTPAELALAVAHRMAR